MQDGGDPRGKAGDKKEARANTACAVCYNEKAIFMGERACLNNFLR